MSVRFDGPTVFGWADPNPGRYYVCRNNQCLNADPQNRVWDEAVPECSRCRRRMILAADQTYPHVREG